MRRTLSAVVLVAATSVGCSPASTDPVDPATPAMPESSEAPETPDTPDPADTAGGREPVQIVISGDRVEPNGERLEVDAGEPIALVLESDRPGELHVHSSPEQTFEVPEGRSEIELTVETPGVVDVEEHESGVVVVRLEVR